MNPSQCVCLLGVVLIAVSSVSSLSYEVCVGTEHKSELLISKKQHVDALRTLYTGCEVVLGNLELTHLERGANLTFLKDIREVMGYMLVSLNEVEIIPLENLRIIRGMKLYQESFALVIVGNNGPGGALQELPLINLTEILNGNVQIRNNSRLCNVESINWEDIIGNYDKKTSIDVDTQGKPNCAPCPPICKGNCWLPQQGYCQKIMSLNCAKECVRQCYGNGSKECCHNNCVSGCTGPLQSNCFACRDFGHGYSCLDSCPPPTLYDPNSFETVPNPDGTYRHGAICVKQCPSNFFSNHDSCARSCPNNQMEVEENDVRVCKPCPDSGCPNFCNGIGTGSLINAVTVNSTNLAAFNDCTTISGNLVFLPQGISGDITAHPEKLNVFKKLQEITGYLHIEAWPQGLTDLGVFENLRVVHGRHLRSVGFSLLVMNISHITHLGLRSLTDVTEGSVLIRGNPSLCYTPSVTWKSLMPSARQHVVLDKNRPEEKCKAEHLVCDPLCSAEGCWGQGPAQCLRCDYFQRGDNCVQACHVTESENPEFIKGIECLSCDAQCLPINGSLSCNGTGADACFQCRHFKDGSQCVEKCLSSLQGKHGDIVYKFYDEEHRCLPCHPNCTHGCDGPMLDDCKGLSGTSSPTPIVVAGVVGILFVALLATLVVLLFKRRNNKRRKKKLRKYIDQELVPLTPTGGVPNQAQLRILKETELRKGKVLGTGAFGTVYKGLWLPEGETLKIPVAIKVLQETTVPHSNKDMLEEAFVMASIEHQHLVRLLGICLTSPVQLVTQLMPYGCLLTYVRENRNSIGSQPLLNWCVQIAKGMMYLEERRLVHRDLAARNVLVKAPNHVKITDFGLAKLLAYNQTEYYASDGKLPIKWMALESIQQRIFTHQTDVWSYGVTVWELMTFGGKPYEGVSARDIPELLEKGERLTQPHICTIDVYMIMVKCWMIDADSRPRFRELAAEFSKMARDPSRYLVIEDDDCMKLPSPMDGRTLPLLDDEDMGQIVDAEEYLRPQIFGMPHSGQLSSHVGTASHGHTSNGTLGNSTADSSYGSDQGAAAPHIQPQPRSLSRPAGGRRGSKGGGNGDGTPSGTLRNGCCDDPKVWGLARDESARLRYISDPTRIQPRDEMHGNHAIGGRVGVEGAAESDGPMPHLDNPEYMNPFLNTRSPIFETHPDYLNMQEPGCEGMPRLRSMAVPSSVENPEYLEPDCDRSVDNGPQGPPCEAFDNPEYLQPAGPGQQLSLENPEYLALTAESDAMRHRANGSAMENPEYLLSARPRPPIGPARALDTLV
uniref:receptor tyrosine-protein kinase erbB-4-like isoform X2 n=1 Tax=Myxine glutinosa TaxID=7769 RepID=UPI00359015F8